MSRMARFPRYEKSQRRQPPLLAILKAVPSDPNMATLPRPFEPHSATTSGAIAGQLIDEKDYRADQLDWQANAGPFRGSH